MFWIAGETAYALASIVLARIQAPAPMSVHRLRGSIAGNCANLTKLSTSEIIIHPLCHKITAIMKVCVVVVVVSPYVQQPDV